jgi:tripartite-type tricarboxylate transporter receptor subunit TctC
MTRFLSTALVAALVCAPLAAAVAQDYPNHPIRLISPYEPGGGTDILARLIGQKMSIALGQSVIVENRPGAGGVVGTQVVVAAPPDGYTIMLTAPSAIVVMPYLRKGLSYEPLRDLAPITLIAVVPALLVVNPAVPVHSVKELIALAKAEPGKLTFGSSGIGGTAHLAGEMMNEMTGVSMRHIPYKGTGPANTALLGGQVSMSFSDMMSVLRFVKSGQLRALAVTTPERSSVLPDLPAISETLPGYSAAPWYGLFAPAKTPTAIIDKLNRVVIDILKEPEMKRTMIAQGADPIGDTPAQFMTFLKADSARWKTVIREAHITAD